jgi:dihydroorotate dehydrogenase
MLVKIAPDLSESDVDAAARVLTDLQVDGVIATNTTISRTLVEGSDYANETGGLSGRPVDGRVHRPSCACCARACPNRSR